MGNEFDFLFLKAKVKFVAKEKPLIGLTLLLPPEGGKPLS